METYVCRRLPGALHTSVTLPGSKSITNRALVAAALADGQSILRNVLLADDTRLMIEALRALGIPITIDELGSAAEVTGCWGHLPAFDADLFCGNSGTTLRFCTALCALGQGKFRLDGVQRMRERPMGGLVEALRSLGVRIEYEGKEGYPPLVVHADGLRGGHVVFESPQSSQFVSALLLAAPYASQDIFIEVHGSVSSVPYIGTTLKVMEHYGVGAMDSDDPGVIRFVVEAPQRYRGTNLAIEPDATNAMYFLTAAAIVGGSVTVEGIGASSIQGDVEFVDVLEKMGCSVMRTPDRLTVSGPADARLHGVDVDLNAMPDTVQTLAVAALFADSPTTIRNVRSLRLKETDRLRALTRELTKMGAEVEEYDDGLHITPPKVVRAVRIKTYQDHRMAMSFALAGLRIEGIEIEDPQCCAKSMPDYFQRLAQISP